MNDTSFDDYYEDLQVSPNADVATIDRVYRLLAKQYHPDNRDTGNLERFEILTTAHRILSDPEKRAAYDVTYEENRSRRWQSFFQAIPEGKLEADDYRRNHLLSVLYVRCRENPREPGVGLWRLEQMLGWPENLMDFHSWYLKEKGYVVRNDSGGLAITASGVDKIEEEGLAFGKDRLLPETTGEGKQVNRIQALRDTPDR